MNPRSIAEAIVANMPENDVISKVGLLKLITTFIK